MSTRVGCSGAWPIPCNSTWTQSSTHRASYLRPENCNFLAISAAAHDQGLRLLRWLRRCHVRPQGPEQVVHGRWAGHGQGCPTLQTLCGFWLWRPCVSALNTGTQATRGTRSSLCGLLDRAANHGRDASGEPLAASIKSAGMAGLVVLVSRAWARPRWQWADGIDEHHPVCPASDSSQVSMRDLGGSLETRRCRCQGLFWAA